MRSKQDGVSAQVDDGKSSGAGGSRPAASPSRVDWTP